MIAWEDNKLNSGTKDIFLQEYQNGDFKGFLKQIQYRNNGTLEWELIGMYENRAFIKKAAMKICYQK